MNDTPIELATRANELLGEIAKSMLSLEYLWDELQNRYYEHSVFERMESALNVGYPFKDSYEDVVRGVMCWNIEVSNALDKVFSPIDFVGDEEKMIDFIGLSKEEFLASYSYLTEAEYEATKKRILKMAKEASE